jgi:hypothetical protein
MLKAHATQIKPKSPPKPKGGNSRNSRNSAASYVEPLLKAVNRLESEPQTEMVEEEESWLDMGIRLLKQFGPMALEVAPMLLALL